MDPYLKARHILSLTFTGMLLSYPAEAIVPPALNSHHQALKTEIELGFIYSKSNTTTSTINSRIKLDYNIKVGEKRRALGQELTARHYFSKDDVNITTQKVQLEYQANYSLGSSSALFGRVELEYDEFASYINKQTISSGYSYSVYDFTKSKLKFEAGPGYRYSKPNDKITTEDNLKSSSEPIIRGAVIWAKRFNKNLKVSSDASIEQGLENTINSFNARLENHLLGDLSLAFEVRYKYTRVVPEDSANSEFFSNLNLMYSF